MGVGEVIGGVAALGTAVLIGLALTADDSPETITSATPVALAPEASDAPASSTTAAPATTDGGVATIPDTVVPLDTGSDTTEADTTTTTTAAATTTTARSTTTTSSTIATLPDDQRPAVRLRVLNAGAEPGAAAFVTGVLKQSGFEPIEPRDASERVEAVTIYYAPGREAEAQTVNTVVEADPARVTPPPTADANWAAFGGDVDVLVLLGPPT